MARVRTKNGRRSAAQWALLATNVVLVIACLGGAAVLTKLRDTLSSVPVVDIGSTLSAPADVTEPRNVLIIGTDSAARLSEEDVVTKGRVMSGASLADVVMILRVDPATGTARLLSIPRDSRVELPDGGMDRINAAMAGADGPRTLIQTIKRNFGVSIDNYVEVDFASFKQLVNVLGGVPVYFTTPVRDRRTGLLVEEPGCRELGPDQALAYARSRHFYFQEDGVWRADGTGDLGRITRQQDFIKRAMRRASDVGIRNPSTAVGLIDAASSAVVLDDTLTVGTLVDLLNQFRNFNPDSLQTVQAPTVYAPRSGVDYQDIVWDETEPLLEPFRGVEPGAAVAADNVIVDVQATEEQQTLMAAVVDQLDAAGFDAELYESRSTPDTTTIAYGPKGRDAAVLLARQLQAVPRLVEDEDIAGYRVVLTVGSDFQGAREEALPVDQLPPDLRQPSTTAAPPASTASTVPTTTALPSSTDTTTDDGSSVDGTTTTTLADAEAPPGIVPTDPEKAAACR